MADIALRQFQVGLETTYGTAVAATRPWYGQGAIQGTNQNPVMVNEDRGSYDMYHRASQHVLDYEWSFQGGLDLDDVVEQLKMAVDKAATPTGAGPYVWTFTPGTTLASATVEWDASGDEWEAPGCMCDMFRLSGDANGGDVTLEMEGPAQDRTATTLTSLSDHVTNVIQGWELEFYLDNLGDTPGSTEVDITLLSWNIEIQNNIQRKRRGTNARTISGVARGRRMLTGSLLCEIDTAAVQTLITEQEAVTEKLVRLALGNNVVISGVDKYYMHIDVPCALQTNVIEENDETTVVSFDFNSIYDTTNAFAYEITVQNNRAS